MLAIHWLCIGYLVVSYWLCIGCLLAMHWLSVGTVVCLTWYVLVMCWLCSFSCYRLVMYLVCIGKLLVIG